MVESMTKYKIAKVDIHVQSVVFDKPAEPEKENMPAGEEPQTQSAAQDEKAKN